MAKIERSEVLKALQEGLRLDVGKEKTPTEVADKILAVFKLNPEPEIQVLDASSSDAASVTIRTNPTNKRTFLKSIVLTTAKSVLSTSLFSRVNVTDARGVATIAAIIRYEPVTAGEFSEQFIFSGAGLELEQGSEINIVHSTAIASIDTSVILEFYEVEF